ncbi:MAG: hypothetical protein JW830_14375 [Bacteroidales bacterium]|nr:hypothetical protein [Bacteroidales bacterium]
MKTTFGLIGLMALLNTWSSAAIDPVSAGARSLGMSGAGVMLTGQGPGVGNPAGLAVLSDLTLGLQYANYFMVPELGQGAFSVGLPAMTGAFSLDYTSLGNSVYRENQVCVSFGKSLGGKLRAGISMHYLVVRQPTGFENLSVISPSLGLQVMPADELTIGFRVFNPAAQNYRPEGYLKLPVIIQAGLGYKLGEEVLVCFEAEKKENEKIKYCGGIEISWKNSLIARFGVSSGVFPGYSFGLGFQCRSLRIDLAATRHPVLGFSPVITLAQTVGSVKKKL